MLPCGFAPPVLSGQNYRLPTFATLVIPANGFRGNAHLSPIQLRESIAERVADF